MSTKGAIVFFLSMFILLSLSQGESGECQARDDFLKFCGISFGSLFPVRARPYCCQQVRNIKGGCLVGLSKREQFFINGATKICDNPWINVPPSNHQPPQSASSPSEPPHKICESVTQLLDTCGASQFVAPEDARTYCCLQVRKITKHCYVDNLDPMERKLLRVAKNICDDHQEPLRPTPSPDVPTPAPSPDVSAPVPSPSPSPDVPTPSPPFPSPDVPTPAQAPSPSASPSPDVPTPSLPSPSPCPSPSPDVPTPVPSPSPSPDVPTPSLPSPSPDVPTPSPPFPSPDVPSPSPDVPTPSPPSSSPHVPTPGPSPSPTPYTPTPSPDVPTPAPSPFHRTRPATCSVETVLYDSCNPQRPHISNASNASEEEKEFVPDTTDTAFMIDQAGCCVGFAIFTNDCKPAIKDLSYAKRNIYDSLEEGCTYTR